MQVQQMYMVTKAALNAADGRLPGETSSETMRFVDDAEAIMWAQSINWNKLDFEIISVVRVSYNGDCKPTELRRLSWLNEEG